MSWDPISAIADVVGKVIDRAIPDPVAAANAKLEVMKMQQAGDLAQLAADTQLAQGQLDINKVEASSQNLFVSGWRPFIGWVCGGALAYHYVFQQLISFVCNILGHKVDLPDLNIGELSNLTFAMLGLGTMRTVEKVKGAECAPTSSNARKG